MELAYETMGGFSLEVTLKRVSDEGDLTRLARLAKEIWHQHFITILTVDQIDYMVNKFQSLPAMTNQINQEGYEYYFIVSKGQEVGYTGVKKDHSKLFLSKLYLQKEHRGKGYASYTMEKLKEIAKSRNLSAIWLTVNRYNLDTIAIYKKMGFEVVRTQIVDIGEGYVMDDYVMELRVNSNGVTTFST